MIGQYLTDNLTSQTAQSLSDLMGGGEDAIQMDARYERVVMVGHNDRTCRLIISSSLPCWRLQSCLAP